MAESKPTLVPVEEVAPIAKPSGFSLDKFKAKRTAAVASVETLQAALPHYKFAAAKDFVRLHPDEDNYWSPELCFVNVPIKGQKNDTLHLIDEALAMQYLPSGKLIHFRLALATKPHDIFFLCHVPTRNLDNKYNATTLAACEQAKTTWIQLTSLKEHGVEDYERTLAHDPDAIPVPKWPTQSLDSLIGKTFAGCAIEQDDHPGLLRLIGAWQSLSRVRTSPPSSSAILNMKLQTANYPTCCAWWRTY
jgi:hypothetical protein